MGATIRDFISFTECLGISERWVGASARSINELEKSAGIELPDYYRTFLEMFGQHPGSIRLGTESKITVEQLLGYYACPIRRARVPLKSILIAECFIDPDLAILTNSGVTDGPIVEFYDGDIERVAAESFRHLLHQETWIHAKFSRKIYRSELLPAGIRLSDTSLVLQKVGLSQLDFSDSHRTFWESDGTWIAAQVSAGRVALWLGGGDLDVVDELACGIRATVAS
jgi:hypothetical protein